MNKLIKIKEEERKIRQEIDELLNKKDEIESALGEKWDKLGQLSQEIILECEKTYG